MRRYFFFQAEDGIRDYKVTGVQTCALPIWLVSPARHARPASRNCAKSVNRKSSADQAGRPEKGQGTAPSKCRWSSALGRSEERRVGKECGCRGSADEDR